MSRRKNAQYARNKPSSDDAGQGGTTLAFLCCCLSCVLFERTFVDSDICMKTMLAYDSTRYIFCVLQFLISDAVDFGGDVFVSNRIRHTSLGHFRAAVAYMPMVYCKRACKEKDIKNQAERNGNDWNRVRPIPKHIHNFELTVPSKYCSLRNIP